MKSDARLVVEEFRTRRAALAATLVEAELSGCRGLFLHHGEGGREKFLQDIYFQLDHLATSLEFDSPEIFIDCVAWTKVVLLNRGTAVADLEAHLDCMARVLRSEIPDEAGTFAASFVDAALRALPAMPDTLPGNHANGNPLSLLAYQYEQALLRDEPHIASRLVMEEADRGTPVGDIYLAVFQPTQHDIGRLWQQNEISAAKEHYCTSATQMVMSRLYPRVLASERLGRSLVATSVSGNLHELGIRMVADFFEMAGWDTFFLGANWPHAGVIAALVERQADLLAVSATIPTHASAARALIHAVRSDPACARVRILVGGEPFNRNPELWRQVGADATARDAQEAITVASELFATRAIDSGRRSGA